MHPGCRPRLLLVHRKVSAAARELPYVLQYRFHLPTTMGGSFVKETELRLCSESEDKLAHIS